MNKLFWLGFLVGDVSTFFVLAVFFHASIKAHITNELDRLRVELANHIAPKPPSPTVVQRP